jgi:hypothetical protein
MIAPLLDSTARYSLRGSNGSLMIVSEEDISQARQADRVTRISPNLTKGSF